MGFNDMTKFLVLSDTHFEFNTEISNELSNLNDYDCALLAGDIAVEDSQLKTLFDTYFQNKKVCFLGGNHICYRKNSSDRFIENINANLHKSYPLDNNISFMENDYKIIDNTVIIGCNLYTDYKLRIRKLAFEKMKTDEYGQRIFLDKNDNNLYLHPSELPEFHEKVRKIKEKYGDLWYQNDDYFKEYHLLLDSVAPKTNESGESFKKRVSPEIYNIWEQCVFENPKKIALIPYTTNDYIKYNKNIALRYMNDFNYGRTLENPYLILTPDIYEKWHKQSLNYIKKIYNKFKDTTYNIIVMTHHCPTYKLQDEKYANMTSNGSFFSNLERFIKDRPKIKYWICGHIHNRKTVVIGNTTIIANPYGYEHYNEHIGFKPVYIEL